MKINPAAKIGVGLGIAGATAKYYKVSDPLSLLGLTVMGQALAWMPDFVVLCLRGLKTPPPTLSSLPQLVQTRIQASLDPRDAIALRLTERAQYSMSDPFGAAVLRFESKNSVTLAELRKLLNLNRDYSNRKKMFTLDLSKSDISDTELQIITQKFPNIIAIDAKMCPGLSNEGLASLATLTNLETLDLSSCYQITDTGIRHLRGLTKLAVLGLRGCWVTDIGLQDLAGLAKLSALSLYGCSQISNSGLEHLRGLINLKTLELSFCPRITDEGLRHLNSLSQLVFLRLIATGITGPGMQYLAHHINLQTLHLPQRMTDAGLVHLAGLTNLRDLDLGGSTSITHNGLQYLANLNSLVRLNLGHCYGITDATLNHLSGLTNLRYLNLAFCHQITNAGLQFLTPLINLENLDLSAAGGRDSIGLGHLALLPNLASLNLSSNYSMTDHQLVELARCPKLKSLNLSNCCITQGLHHLRGLRTLKQLNLSDTPWMPVTGLHILFPNLEDLILDGCTWVTDAVLQELAGQGALRHLNLNSCFHISDSGLASLATLTTLKTLHVTLNRSPQLTEAGLQQLETQLPELEITRH